MRIYEEAAQLRFCILFNFENISIVKSNIKYEIKDDLIRCLYKISMMNTKLVKMF